MSKKKSNSAIGNANVDEYIRDFLDPERWLSAKAGRTSRFSGEDMFGLFDIVSLKKDGILLTQVKTNQARTTFTEMTAWATENRDNLPENLFMQLAVKKKATKTKPERWIVRDIIIKQEM